jgi:hypothetical protein
MMPPGVVLVCVVLFIVAAERLLREQAEKTTTMDNAKTSERSGLRELIENPLCTL